uniref:Uncharacterized protein n=1 Tax=Magnetococcus massalia (strain MO-1) TaxID=451514 RepID=A0A1S7LMC7_MAGMO|nr:protein of unknown function [Candidatus Magnetococcus massalia]
MGEKKSQTKDLAKEFGGKRSTKQPVALIYGDDEPSLNDIMSGMYTGEDDGNKEAVDIIKEENEKLQWVIDIYCEYYSLDQSDPDHWRGLAIHLLRRFEPALKQGEKPGPKSKDDEYHPLFDVIMGRMTQEKTNVDDIIRGVAAQNKKDWRSLKSKFYAATRENRQVKLKYVLSKLKRNNFLNR